jgi:hypothetical protein
VFPGSSPCTQASAEIIPRNMPQPTSSKSLSVYDDLNLQVNILGLSLLCS